MAVGVTASPVDVGSVEGVWLAGCSVSRVLVSGLRSFGVEAANDGCGWSDTVPPAFLLRYGRLVVESVALGLILSRRPRQ